MLRPRPVRVLIGVVLAAAAGCLSFLLPGGIRLQPDG